jgi:C4-dicarboxylate-specific signal transduction histidine kinase
MSKPERRLTRRLPSRRFPTAVRIRTKMVLLHTLFSMTLAAVLLLVLYVPLNVLVGQSAERESELALELLAVAPERASELGLRHIELQSGTAAELRLEPEVAERARSRPGQAIAKTSTSPDRRAVMWVPEQQIFLTALAPSKSGRAAINDLFLVLTLSLLGVYFAIALALEVFVLPKQVYAPIERLRRADQAVQAGERNAELIPDQEIPNDELGEIMRSRNQSILKLRRQEQALNEALDQIESVAGELKRKNHLLEAARRNLADQDRLASLGMMSAGIAHELNTPLAVVKGCVERMAEEHRAGNAIDTNRLALLQRVVGRLERLGESLLDFARVRPPSTDIVHLHQVIEEAWELVSLDRDAKRIHFEPQVDPELTVLGDADRLTQVFVNLLRNAVDAFDPSGDIEPTITVASEEIERSDDRWISITVTDNGPGIDPAVLARLFEPFATTRLDARGTGLGLAVAEGIVKEHAGVVVARNASPPERGAVFEVMLPAGAGVAQRLDSTARTP